MAETRRPSSGVVSKSLRLAWDHATTIFGFAAVICLPTALVTMNTALNPGPPALVLEQLVALATGLLVSYGSILAFRLFQEGTDPGVGGLLKKSFARGLISFAGTRVAVGLLLTIAVAVGMSPFLLAAVQNPEVFTRANPPDGPLQTVSAALMLSAPVGIGLLIWAYLQLGLAAPANVIEGLSPSKSIGRSRSLLRGKKFDFFMVLMTLIAVRFALSLVLGGPGAMVGGGTDPFEVQEVGANPFHQERLFEILGRTERLDPAAAAVVGVSSYLYSVAILVVSAFVLAQFFLALRGPLELPTAEPSSETPEAPPAK